MKRTIAVLAGFLALSWSGVSQAKAPDGKPLFLKYKCNSCHSIDAAGVVKKAAPDEGESTTKKKPPDLSGVGVKKKADWIALFLQKKEKEDGELHPKKFRGTDSDLKTIAVWLETMKTEKPKAKAEATEEKSEEKAAAAKENVEEKAAAEAKENSESKAAESGSEKSDK